MRINHHILCYIDKIYIYYIQLQIVETPITHISHTPHTAQTTMDVFRDEEYDTREPNVDTRRRQLLRDVAYARRKFATTMAQSDRAIDATRQRYAQNVPADTDRRFLAVTDTFNDLQDAYDDFGDAIPAITKAQTTRDLDVIRARLPGRVSERNARNIESHNATNALLFRDHNAGVGSEIQGAFYRATDAGGWRPWSRNYPHDEQMTATATPTPIVEKEEFIYRDAYQRKRRRGGRGAVVTGKGFRGGLPEPVRHAIPVRQVLDFDLSRGMLFGDGLDIPAVDWTRDAPAIMGSWADQASAACGGCTGAGLVHDPEAKAWVPVGGGAAAQRRRRKSKSKPRGGKKR